MTVENPAPLTMMLTMDPMLSYSSILFAYQITFLASFPLTNSSPTTVSISHSWPIPFSPFPSAHPFKTHPQVCCEATHTLPG